MSGADGRTWSAYRHHSALVWPPLTARPPQIFTDPAARPYRPRRAARPAASRTPRPICFRPARAAAKKQCQSAGRRCRISISCLLSRWNAAAVDADTAGRAGVGAGRAPHPSPAAPPPPGSDRPDLRGDLRDVHGAEGVSDKNDACLTFEVCLLGSYRDRQCSPVFPGGMYPMFVGLFGQRGCLVG